MPVSMLLAIVAGALLAAVGIVLLILMLTRKNCTVYAATGKGNEYDKCGRLLIRPKRPELRIDRLKNIPEGVIAIEVDEPAARKLFGQTISIHYFSETFTHTVGTVNGAYWFKVDVGTAPDDDDVEEEPQ